MVYVLSFCFPYFITAEAKQSMTYGLGMFITTPNGWSLQGWKNTSNCWFYGRSCWHLVKNTSVIITWEFLCLVYVLENSVTRRCWFSGSNSITKAVQAQEAAWRTVQIHGLFTSIWVPNICCGANSRADQSSQCFYIKFRIIFHKT